MKTIKDVIAEYKDDFDLFESGDEKLEYIFDLGKRHTTLPDELKNDSTFIEGCASPAWLSAECKDGVLILKGEGSSEMAKGMLTLLLDIFSNKKAQDILEFNPQDLQELGIVELLSPVRQQSLEAFLNKVYEYARECANKKAES
jgi:cysteine desulfuration protein SufE